ncbi:hypothetical protein JAAARDRAFT_189089 [Jaapia argillacea MUCL 33604]|uniref:Molybdenum cofactor synthesis 2 n=1 Tax=Jaapia argillacea MUCL 33604 TaxID=933084 RepID=A0A067Q901_9AGAM|nr:hypothetical protein JAAARDRAFT_189089 [Jaapia argillacea MUCL 33604]
MSGPSPYSVDARSETDWGICVLTHTPLDVPQIIQSVGDPAAGATAVFIGTTRNSFKGRTVTRLDYQAFSKLAINTMSHILVDAVHQISRSDHHTSDNPVPSLIRCALHHRLGTVPVGEPSIVIAVSSPHRKEAFVACESILEQVKRKAQIWKREFYEGDREEDAEWKANE